LETAGRGLTRAIMNASLSLLSSFVRSTRLHAFGTAERRESLPPIVNWLFGNESAKAQFNVARILVWIALYPFVSVAVTTVLMIVILHYTSFKFKLIVYLIPVVICAVRGGFISAVVGVFASAAVADFFFIQPLYSFAISDPEQIFEMALFLFVALVTSNLAARLKRELETVRRGELEIHDLYELSRRLALCATAGDLLKAMQDYLSARLGSEALLVHPAPFDAAGGSVDDNAVPEQIARAAKNMMTARELGSRLVTEPGTNSLWALKHITTMMAQHGVLAVNLGKAGGRDADKLNDRIDALLLEAGATLNRIDAAAALTKANMRLESEVLKTALLGIASHELRSPVAAILGTASVLDEMPSLRGDEDVRSLVQGMHREAKRLYGDIQNILDTARITNGGVKPHLVWTDPADIFTAAIRHRSHLIVTHKLTVSLHPDMPMVNVDPLLLQQVVGQLIENAVKYSPSGSTIALAGRTEDGEAVFSVTDEGAGLTEEEAANLFRHTYRGRRHLGNVPGLGLGLWIARILTAVNGGALSARSPGPGRGTTMSIRLPVPPDIPSEAEPTIDGQAG
jgi:K+-sensing histidine kinase KdpD